MTEGRGGRAARLAVVRWVGLSLALAMTPPSWAGDGVVRAVLFSSPTCPHCQKVREQVLPALGARFAGRLQVAVFSTATPTGRDLYWAAFERFGVQQRGVPLLVVGDFALVGSVEIPQRLPSLVESYLAKGGVDWPPLPGLGAALAAINPAPPTPPPAPVREPEAPVIAETANPPSAASDGTPPAPQLEPASPEPAAEASAVTTAAAPTPSGAVASTRPAPAVRGEGTPRPTRAPATVPPASPEPATPGPRAAEPSLLASPVLALDGGDELAGPIDRFRADPRGNGLAVLVLVGMLGAVLRSAVAFRRPIPPARTNAFDWLTPVLALCGLGVAAYLAQVEVRDVEAVCGPVGDCNTVQQSAYARLFGVLPIGVLGVLGFAAILVAWAVRRWGPGPAASWAAVAILAMTGLGTLFSIYLTFLEPFVIGATCLWCLSSAVIMTALNGLAQAPGRAAATRIRHRPSSDSSPQVD